MSKLDYMVNAVLILNAMLIAIAAYCVVRGLWLALTVNFKRNNQ